MPKPRPTLLLLSYLAFVSLGLPDTVLGIAWPSLRARFELPQSAMGAVLATGVSGYFVSGLVAGSLMGRFGVGRLLAGSSALVALGLTSYSLAPSWYAFFPVAGVMGLGSGAIDAALNGYSARHFSVRHVNWLHACWGIGASLGPVIMTAAIARGHGYPAGYAVLAAMVGALALSFAITRQLWDEPSAGVCSGSGEQGAAAPLREGVAAPPAVAAAVPVSTGGSAGAALRDGRVWLLIASFFCYTGLESSVGQWCFTWLTEGRGLGVEAAGSWTAAYWASLTLGRIALGFVVDRAGPDRVLRLASGGIIAGTALFALAPGALGRLGLLVLGASLAPVYPTLIARTPLRVGAALAPYTVGFLVSGATLGSSLLPGAIGVLVGRLGLAAIGSAALAMGLAFLILHEVLLRVSDAGTEPARAA